MTRSPAALTLLVLAGSCGGEQAEPVFASASASILREGGALWVASPDDDALVEIDAASLAERGWVELEGAPVQLAAVGEAKVVGLARAAAFAWVEGGRATRHDTPCGGTGAVAALPDGSGLVACPNDDRLLRVGPEGVRQVLALPGRPSALAVSGEDVIVASSRGGSVHVLAVEDVLAAPAGLPPRSVPMETRALAPEPGFAATRLHALAADGRGGVALAYQRVDHDSDRDRPAERGGYGSVVDEAPRIEPRLLAPCGGRYARFDGGPLAMSGPSALAWHGEAGLLWVAHRSTGNVALVACPAARGLAEPSPRRPRVLATWRVGRGPGGIALSDDGRTAWVDVGFDHAVARLVWDGVEGPHALDAALRRPLGETRLSARALEGRSVFFDARDTHLTPSGVVSCASCHPGGGEDGLRWFLHTPGVERKLRRTPPAWGARPSLAPYHWDGEFEEAERLALVTIRELMEGDGLLVDLEALAAFMAERPPPPPRPADDPAAAARGEALFAERCESCHRDRVGADGAAHGLLPPSADPDALMPAVHTPSLAGVRARPPFLHDGRAPTLRAVLTDANPADAHARTSDLDAAALADLLAYLETL